MSLLEQARADANTILETGAGSLSVDAWVIEPGGFGAKIPGMFNDIEQTVDPGTGEFLTGRRISIAMSQQDFYDAGFDQIPRGIADGAKKPWIVSVKVDCTDQKFKVVKSNPDRTVGVVVCILGLYFD